MADVPVDGPVVLKLRAEIRYLGAVMSETEIFLELGLWNLWDQKSKLRDHNNLDRLLGSLESEF
jgi:hypothetical protein